MQWRFQGDGVGEPGIVDWLRDRAFGGRQAVAVPRADAAAGPRGPFPAGVQELIDFLVSTYEVPATERGCEQWGFLVGAPGNGKSEAMRALAGALGVPPTTDTETAPRELLGTTRGGAAVRLVNDASIPREDSLRGGSLARDIEEALAAASGGSGVLLFANVNRGVLVEERNIAKETAPDDVAGLLAWLNEVASGEHVCDPATSYYARRVVQAGEKQVVVHVLSLDALSLFEPQPRAGSAGKALDFSGGDDPVVAPYGPVGGLQIAPRARKGAAAAVLAREISDPSRWAAQGCEGCAASPLCPFRANAVWLADENLRDGFLDTFRAVEVAAGRRMTYRDLLATFAVAVLGPSEPSWDEGKHPCEWAGELAEDGGDAAIGHLARHRIYASCFPPPLGDAWKRLGKGRVAAASLYTVVLADFGPARAGERPGPFAGALDTLDPAASIDDWDGLRPRVLDAAEAMHVESPLAALDLPVAALSELDHRLDAAVLGFMRGEAEQTTAGRQRVPQVRKWRSIMLLRHAGLAGGWIADREAVQAWLGAQEATLAGGSAGELLTGLRRLLVPPGDTLFLAPFRPRTRAFDTDLPVETLLVGRRSSELGVELRASRDSLQFSLRTSVQQGKDMLVPVDLDLAREALVVAKGQGFTDLPDQAIARVERVLASLIARGRPAILPHVTDAEGRLHRIRGPWGQHTLVQERKS